MVPSQTELAKALGALLDQERVTVSETRTRIGVNQLTGAEADRLFDMFGNAGWTDIAVANEGDLIPREMIAASTAVLRLTATPPAIPDTVEAVLTKSGLASLLNRDPAYPIIWIEGMDSVVDTLTVRYAPWGTEESFLSEQELASPSRVARVLGGEGPGEHLGRWTLRSTDTKVDAAALEPWRSRAASRLLAALAQEIEPDGQLLFRGPPPTRFVPGAAPDISADGFAATQAVAKWVFENEREVEARHGLVAAEVARTSLRDGALAALAAILKPALEGAKIAYNFGVTQQSKDTLKALSDLRKAVTDDAAKLSETTRSLATAIVGAVFGNIGLIVARLTLPANGVFIGYAAMLIGIVLALYVGSVIISGWQYLSIQQGLRRDWRSRLYRFLADDEYERMVEAPAKRAECFFWITAGIGVVMTLLLLAAVYFIAAAPPVKAADPGNRAGNAAAVIETDDNRTNTTKLIAETPCPTPAPKSAAAKQPAAPAAPCDPR